jgi:hypothetical protein
VGTALIVLLSLIQIAFGCVIIRAYKNARNENIILAFERRVGYGRTDEMRYDALYGLACASFYALVSCLVAGALYLIFGKPEFWYMACSIGWWFAVWVTCLILRMRGRDLYQYVIYGPEGSFAERLCEIQ